MPKQVSSRTRSPSKRTSEFSTVSDGGMFQSRPFVMQSKVGEEGEKSGLKTSLMRAERYGHHPSQMQFAGVSDPQTVQPKKVTRQPLESQRAEAPPMQLAPGSRKRKRADSTTTTTSTGTEKDKYEGLFTPGADSIPVKNYNQKQGHNGEAREWEHPVPGASYPKGNKDPRYKSAPVMGIPTSVHRNGEGGAGGGVSSTGRSTTAQGWSKELGKDIKDGKFAKSLQRGLIDDINAAHVNGKLSQDWANAAIQIIDKHLERKDIEVGEAGELRNFVMDAVLSRLESPKKYGGGIEPTKPKPK
jgi:hypothetical protein